MFKKVLFIVFLIIAFLIVARLDNVDTSTSQVSIKEAKAQAKININSHI